MKVQLTRPEHLSYKTHRKQVIVQIILPVILAAFLCLAMTLLVILSTFPSGGDASRWAAISTIWLSLPMMAGGLLFFAILAGLIIVIGRGLQIIPEYTGKAQDFVYKARSYAIRAANLVVKPILILEGWISSLKALFGGK